MYTVGKLDKNIYNCMGVDFISDEVIITEEQLKHVKERHPDAYENTAQDPAGYNNSIITSWEISERRLQNYLRNKKILYRKE